MEPLAPSAVTSVATCSGSASPLRWEVPVTVAELIAKKTAPGRPAAAVDVEWLTGDAVPEVPLRPDAVTAVAAEMAAVPERGIRLTPVALKFEECETSVAPPAAPLTPLAVVAVPAVMVAVPESAGAPVATSSTSMISE